MSKILKAFLLSIGLGMVAFNPSTGQNFSDENNLDYVLQRYLDAMGGRAALEKMMSVRMAGTIEFKDGRSTSIVVLKKKPNLVRITLLSGNQRIIQAYDGNTAWVSRESGRGAEYMEMEDPLRMDFIREAPIANALVDSYDRNVELELGPETTVVNMPCYQVIARNDDGSKTVHCINQRDFYEVRIYKYDAAGNLTAELIPSDFESIGGVTFALMTKRFSDGELVSTMHVEDVQLNLGILDSAFKPPVESGLGN